MQGNRTSLVDLTSRFPILGGEAAETACLRTVLGYWGVHARHTHQPPSEALLFGAGGGVGLGYFVYESGSFTSLFLGTRITTQETAKEGFVHQICSRLGVKAKPLNASTPAPAEKKVLQALSNQQPVIAWAAPNLLPYFGPPAAYHCLVITGFDAEQETFTVCDRHSHPFQIPFSVMSAARQGEGIPQFRAIVLEEEATEIDMQPAVVEGLRAGYQQMTAGFGPANFRSNFGLNALEKWASLLTNRKDPRGWPRFFPPGPRLLSALVMVYEQIENRGGGSAYRPLYARFLEEAAGLLEKPKLKKTAADWRASANLWNELAEQALPNDTPILAEAKDLLRKKRIRYEQSGPEENQEAADRRLQQLKEACEQAFPASEKQTKDLLSGLQETVMRIHRLESRAVEAIGAEL